MEHEEIRKIVREVLEKELDVYLARYTAGREEEYNRLAILQHLTRLEEELKAQRELMEKRFGAVDKRFEDLYRYLETRFAGIDKRFEAVDKRFEDINKRFEEVNKRFEDVNKRFEDINKRFEDMLHYVDRRFNQLTWLISTMFALLATLITVFRFLG